MGTPGPLDGYCGTGSQAAESAGAPVRQPAGTTLPLAPAYFPHVVRNPDGTLTGYFDYRPKDADEAIIVARSTDNGQSWTYEGEALEQNPGYCPSADVNDDGEGHPNVITVGGTTRLYTLQRPAGDNPGVGLLVHTLAAPTSSDPLSGRARHRAGRHRPRRLRHLGRAGAGHRGHRCRPSRCPGPGRPAHPSSWWPAASST